MFIFQLLAACGCECIVPLCIHPVFLFQTQDQLLHTSFVENGPVQEWFGPRCIDCFQGLEASPIRLHRFNELIDLDVVAV